MTTEGLESMRAILRMILMVGVGLALALPASASAESLCTDSWVGPVEGDWSTAVDWSLGSVPGLTDVACIGAGKVVTVNTSGDRAGVLQGEGSIVIAGGGLELTSALESGTIHSFSMSSGMLSGAGTLGVSGLLSWSGEATLAGSGSLTLLAGGTGTISLPAADASGRLEGRSLVNEGTMTFAQGRLLMSVGAKLVNSGTFNANTENGESRFWFYPKIGPEPVIVNTGTFQKSEGTGATISELKLEDNGGTVKALTGSIFLTGGGASAAGIWAGSGGTVAFASGAFAVSGGQWSGSVSVSGNSSVKAENISATAAQVSLSGGTMTVPSGTMTVERLLISSGVLTGGGTVNVSGSLSWTGEAEMSGPGSTVLEPGATGSLAITGGIGVKGILSGGRLLINEGIATLSEGRLILSEGAQIKNVGTFNANSESTEKQFWFFPKIGAEPKIINRGTFRKTAGTGYTVVEPVFENYGVVGETSGHLIIENPITLVAASTQYGQMNASALEVFRAFCGKPVDCVTGNETESQTDLSVAGRGVGLRLTRTYNAQEAAKAASSGIFGYGWRAPFSDQLVIESTSHQATVYQANGSTITFSEEGGVFTPPAWSGDTLTGSSESGYTLTLADQRKFVFNGSNGRLESETDRNGNQTTLGYNEKGQLATITDPAGRKITLAYNAEGLVETATDPMGHVVKYGYESGNLTSVTLPGETSPSWRFKYDSSHRLTLMINGRGGETANTYDSSNRVIAQKDPLGHTLKFEYEAFQTKVTNEATGAVTLDQYNSNDLVTAITRGYGTPVATTQKRVYNERNEATSVTDGNGHTTTYEYDSAGNKIKQVDPENHETKWSYNTTHDVVSETKPNGETTTITRDEHGNPTLISRPAPGNTTQETHFEYDTHGQVTNMTDPLGRKWTYEYDNQGDRTSETDPEGDKRTWTYNEDSQQTATVSPRGNVTGGEPSKYTTATERDAQGRSVKITDPLGHFTRLSYDANGDRTAVIDPNGRETKTEYNAANEPVKVTLPNGATRETAYDGAGQITSQTDGNKHTTTYTRNVLEQITEVTDPLLHKTTKIYDAAGNLSSITDASKRTTSFTYNKDNQPTKITYSDGITPTVEYEYDKNGDRTSMTDGTGKTTYTYDQLDRLTKAVDGHGNTVGYEYDLANEQTKITYPNGKTVEHTYDKTNRLASVKDWLGNTTSFGYDPDSNLTSITFPSGTSEIDHYAYNEADQQTEAKMSKGTETLGSLLYTRDNNGQVTKTISKGLPGAETTEYAYDTNERLSKASGTTYEYDAANNLTKAGNTTNTFNANDQLTEATGLKYTYDEEGERTKTTPTSGAATTYNYNQVGDLTSVTRPKEGKTAEIKDTYTYNGDGLRVSQTTSGTTTYLGYDHSTPLPLILNDGTNSYIQGPDGMQIEQINAEKPLLMHVDQQGSTRMLSGTTGKVEATMSYEPYGKLSGSTGTATTPLGYDGQYTSSDTGLIYLRARSYDPATAQFMSADPIESITRAPYTYAEDSPLNRSDPTGFGEWEPWTESFWTEGNFISKSPLNPIPYYEKEIESYENGCGYFASVGYGIEGALVSTASLIPLDDAELRVSAWLQAKFPWLSRQVTNWVARDSIARYGQPGWQELIKKVVEHIIR